MCRKKHVDLKQLRSLPTSYTHIFSANEESQSFAEKGGKDKLPWVEGWWDRKQIDRSLAGLPGSMKNQADTGDWWYTGDKHPQLCTFSGCLVCVLAEEKMESWHASIVGIWPSKAAEDQKGKRDQEVFENSG